MAKTKPRSSPAATEATPAAVQAPAAPEPAGQQQPMPTHGGCWVRLPDGSLVPDPAEHPAADPKE